jgi:heptosyltransferase-2
MHVERASGVFGPKFVAAKIRPRRYDTALLFTNSFSSALVVRIAGIPKRIGYDRDARSLLLTQHLAAPRSSKGSWAPVSAVSYYWHAASSLLDPLTNKALSANAPLPPLSLSLATTPQDEAGADAILKAARLAPSSPFVILNPGGNNPAKRWPTDRFARLADHISSAHALPCLINGSPNEADLVNEILTRCNPLTLVASLPQLGISIGTLKALTRRSRLLVTNDTGPRHLAAAFGVPLVSLFGPTDPRWLLFRAWLLADAPSWLVDLYARHGETAAAWIHDKPAVKAALRVLMDRVIATQAR